MLAQPFRAAGIRFQLTKIGETGVQTLQQLFVHCCAGRREGIENPEAVLSRLNQTGAPQISQMTGDCRLR